MALTKRTKNARASKVIVGWVLAARNDLDDAPAPLRWLELGREIGLGVPDLVVLEGDDRHDPPHRAVGIRRAGHGREPLGAGQRQDGIARRDRPALFLAEHFGILLVVALIGQAAGVFLELELERRIAVEALARLGVFAHI